ncbi:Organic cation transporter protein [Nymphon striatum]|nr:Organic cation transporter protein [Nymphon striatum]
MPGSIFVNYACLGIADLVGSILLYGIVKHFRRKLALCIGMFVIAACCSCNLAVKPDDTWLLIGFAMVGIFMVCLVFNITYIVTAELFPTPLRSSAMGTGSMFSRIGGIAAPFVASLVDVWRPLPSVIIGSFALISGFVILFLPETLNKPLPASIEEVEETRDKPYMLKLYRRIRSGKRNSEQVESVSMTKI